METHGLGSGEREVVTSFATQGEALEAIQMLADQKVDAECVTITRDAPSAPAEPEPTHRLTLALVGGLFGAALGAVLGVVLGTSWPMFAGLALGAIVGAWSRMASGTATAAAERAPSRIEVERHDVVTHRERAPEARRVLGDSGFRI